jgi:hypothetical protein
VKLIKLILFVCVSGLMAWASPLSDCTPQPLSAYLTMNSPCVVGRLALSDFAYLPTVLGDGVLMPADQILVNPLAIPGDPGVQVMASWMANGQGGGDSAIGFLVTVLPGGPPIDSVILNATMETGNPNVLEGVVETICLGGQYGYSDCPSADTVSLRVDNESDPSPASLSFAPQTQISVLKDIFIDGLTSDASGTISEATNYYPAPPVPEPGMPLLVLPGLLFIWRLRRRQPARHR